MKKPKPEPTRKQAVADLATAVDMTPEEVLANLKAENGNYAELVRHYKGQRDEMEMQLVQTTRAATIHAEKNASLTAENITLKEQLAAKETKTAATRTKPSPPAEGGEQPPATT